MQRMPVYEITTRVKFGGFFFSEKFTNKLWLIDHSCIKKKTRLDFFYILFLHFPLWIVLVLCIVFYMHLTSLSSLLE